MHYAVKASSRELFFVVMLDKHEFETYAKCSYHDDLVKIIF